MNRARMTKYIHWQDDEMWLGYLKEHPDYWTQGETIEELEENLRDIYRELAGGAKPGSPLPPNLGGTPRQLSSA